MNDASTLLCQQFYFVFATVISISSHPLIFTRMVIKARGQRANGLLSLVSLVLITTQRVSSETTCDLLPPMESKEGPEFGMVLVPGDTLLGESYQPLSMAIQVIKYL